MVQCYELMLHIAVTLRSNILHLVTSLWTAHVTQWCYSTVLRYMSVPTLRISSYKVEKLSKLKKIIMEKEKDSNMATPIILPTLLSINGKQRPLVSFAVPIVLSENRMKNIEIGYQNYSEFLDLLIRRSVQYSSHVSTFFIA